MHRLTLLPDGLTIELARGETMLAAMRRRGLSHRYGCQRGGCGACKVDIVSGTVSDGAVIADTVLTAAERAEGVHLTCRAVPTTDVVARLRPHDRLRQLIPWYLRSGT